MSDPAETSPTLHTITVDDAGDGIRVDTYTAEQLPDCSRSQIAKLIKEGHLTVDGVLVRANHKLKPGETIAVKVPPATPTTVEPENIPLDIIYEDEHLIVVNKAAGMVTHPGTGNWTGTLVNALLHHCRELSTGGSAERAGIVHRLDKGTSGLLVVAKTDTAHRYLANQLQDKTLHRVYLAFAWGHLNDNEGTIDLPIGRSISDPTKMKIDHASGRDAVTTFKVLERYDLCDKLQLTLQTGRTHQIRVHLAHHNHSIFGDPDYAGREERVRGIAPELRVKSRQLLKLIDRPALHAHRLGFKHPATGKSVECVAEPPEDMQNLQRELTLEST